MQYRHFSKAMNPQLSFAEYSPLLARYGIASPEILLERWREPHRFYHTEAHLADLLRQIAQSSFSETERQTLQMVAFFHDIVYLPTRHDNEEASAIFFRQHTSPQADSALIEEIILDTKTHQARSPLSAYFCQIDTAIVRTELPELLLWEDAIFKEFQCFDYSMYKMGRLAVLERFAALYPENTAHLQALIAYVQYRRPKIGVYPGSFNPFHNGHLNILEKAERVFDKVIVARGINPEKQGIEKEALNPVLYYRQVEDFEGLLTDYISQKEAEADITLIRGLRNGDDLAYEMNQLRFMRDMKDDLKTVFFHCDKEFEHISSSAIRNLEKIGQGYGQKYIPQM